MFLRYQGKATSQELFQVKKIMLLPGKSHGRRSLLGCSPWGRKSRKLLNTAPCLQKRVLDCFIRILRAFQNPVCHSSEKSKTNADDSRKLLFRIYLRNAHPFVFRQR